MAGVIEHHGAQPVPSVRYFDHAHGRIHGQPPVVKVAPVSAAFADSGDADSHPRGEPPLPCQADAPGALPHKETRVIAPDMRP